MPDLDLDFGLLPPTAGCASRSVRSLWAKTRSFAPERRAASTMQAWTSLSRMMMSSLPSQRADGAERGGVAGGEAERGVGAFEGGERFVQLVVGRERTADQTRSAGAGAVALDRLDGGLLQRRFVGQAQVIVGGEVEQGPAFEPRCAGTGASPRAAARATGPAREAARRSVSSRSSSHVALHL